MNEIENLCRERGMRITGQRRVISQVLVDSPDHPNIDEVFQRASAINSDISLSTVYRTIRLFEDMGILDKLYLKDGCARYETSSSDHHDHLVNVRSGEIVEFFSEELEQVQKKIARELGYELVDHRLELYGEPIPEQG